MQVNDTHYSTSLSERKEKVEAALARLKSLKIRISELRVQCEALKLKSDERSSLKCEECGGLVEEGQEVRLKDSFGEVKGYYHRNCFKEIWLSQNWRFDYSSPGFLRRSEKNK